VRRFENWESYVAGRIGLGVAVEHALQWGLDDIRERVFALARELRGRLAGTPGVTVHDRGRELCAIVTFSVEGRAAADVAGALRAGGVNVSVSPASWSRADFEDRGLGDAIVRASAHYYNTDEELDRLVAGVRVLTARQSTLS
jgi:selenocysteine lyase/cysteine desulfurase